MLSNSQNDETRPVIPDHELLRMIGKGSYGCVWLARNIMGMYRAVKVVHRRSFHDDRPFERELRGIRKFEPISRSHAGFVNVLHIGRNEEQGYFYYVMELGDDAVTGQDINPDTYTLRTIAREIIQRGRLSFTECLELGLALSDALAELHKHGLVHRDIKPSNIIFVNGVPKLADIGLVADVAEAPSFVGTEGFIPPEGPGTAQADIYSLGKVLYEVSTGKDRHDFPELPTQLQALPDRDAFLELNEVILQACNTNISQRYQFALDMHADLLLLSNGKSVKRLRLLERRLKAAKRTAGVVAAGLALAGLIAYQFYREWRVRVETRQQKVGASLAYGNAAMESGDNLGALPHFTEAAWFDAGNSKEAANHRLRIGSVLAQCPKLTGFWLRPAEVDAVDFSPDSRRIVVAEYTSGASQIYDIESGQPVGPPFGHGTNIDQEVFSPDGRWVAGVCESGHGWVWNVQTLSLERELDLTIGMFCVRFSPDSKRMVVACTNGCARVLDVATGRLELETRPTPKALRFADFSHDGRYIVTAGEDTFARILDATNGDLLVELPGIQPYVTSAAFSPNDQTLVTTSDGHTAQVWGLRRDERTGKLARRLLLKLQHHDVVCNAQFSPDGRLLLTACLDGTVRLWRTDTFQPAGMCPLLRQGDRVTHACFSPDGRMIVATGIDGSVRVWDLAGMRVATRPVRWPFNRAGTRFLVATNDTVQVFDATTDRPAGAVIHPAGTLQQAQFVGEDNFILTRSSAAKDSGAAASLFQAWDTASSRPLGPAIKAADDARAMTSRDGTKLATFSETNVQTWNLFAGTNLSPLMSCPDSVTNVAFSPDGGQIAIASGNCLHVRNSTNGRPLFNPLAHVVPPDMEVPVKYAAYSDDGALLVTCCWDDQFTKCYAQVWNATTGREVGPRLPHGDGVLFAAFSRDKHRVATACEDFKASIWDFTTGRRIAVMQHDNQVRAIEFSPDGRRVLTASSDASARIWDAENGDPLTPPLRYNEVLANASFLTDERHIAISGARGNTWLWELPGDSRPVAEFRDLARFLNGEAAEATANQNQQQPESPVAVWRRLRARHPGDFSTSINEIKAWHENEAQESELAEDWFAAAFHLKCLLAFCPGDTALATRLAVAQENLHKPN